MVPSNVSVETWMRGVLAALLIVALAFVVLFFAGVADATVAVIAVNASMLIAFVLSQVLRRRESKARAAKPNAVDAAPLAPRKAGSGSKRKKR